MENNEFCIMPLEQSSTAYIKHRKFTAELQMDEVKSLKEGLEEYIEKNDKPHKITKVSELFTEELSSIDNEDIRTLVTECLESCPLDPFLYKGASSTGKYHPAECKGVGGLTLHTKYAFRAGLILCDLDPEGPQLWNDYLKGAILLHDGFKYGLDGTSPWTSSDHPELMANFLKDVALRMESNPSAAAHLNKISALVRTHHGKWGPDQPEDKVAWYVHIADMMAANADKVRFAPK